MDSEYFGVLRSRDDLAVALKSKLFQVVHASRRFAVDHFKMTDAEWEEFIGASLRESTEAWAAAVRLRHGQRETVNAGQVEEPMQHKKRKGEIT